LVRARAQVLQDAIHKVQAQFNLFVVHVSLQTHR
jgi:hypothetical protein